MSRARRYFTAEKKARIVRRHLADNVPVSDLADEFGVQPSQIHMWVKQVFDQVEKAFERSGGDASCVPSRGHDALSIAVGTGPGQVA